MLPDSAESADRLAESVCAPSGAVSSTRQIAPAAMILITIDELLLEPVSVIDRTGRFSLGRTSKPTDSAEQPKQCGPTTDVAAAIRMDCRIKRSDKVAERRRDLPCSTVAKIAANLQHVSAALSRSLRPSREQATNFDWRRRPDLNRGWRFCRPLPYHLATAPGGTRERRPETQA